MSNLIQPKILKGFRDFQPEMEIPRKAIIHKLEKVFESYGFLPIDTPVLEYTEVLLGKGGGETDKQLYRFTDNGKRDVAMRFDLTVPFARFMATYSQQLALPFKRYHINKVWRGENTQKGRYREFMQCDFDIVGCDSSEADFEILSMMIASFQALNIEGVSFKLAHRSLFNDFLQKEKIEANLTDILRTVDKLSKIGKEKVKMELEQWCSQNQIEKLLQFISIQAPLNSGLAQAKELIRNQSQGLQRLTEISQLAETLNISNYFTLDLSITRGLDYYTGIVYETFIDALPSIGSVCSGGRYNNLASVYTKEKLPGVGSSIGLDRLMAALEELNLIEKDSTKTDLIIFNMDSNLTSFYFRTAQQLREKGFKVEIYLQNKKLNAQFKYAEKKNIPFAILIGSDEAKAEIYTVKNLIKRENFKANNFDELVSFLKP